MVMKVSQKGEMSTKRRRKENAQPYSLPVAHIRGLPDSLWMMISSFLRPKYHANWANVCAKFRQLSKLPASVCENLTYDCTWQLFCRTQKTPTKEGCQVGWIVYETPFPTTHLYFNSRTRTLVITHKNNELATSFLSRCTSLKRLKIHGSPLGHIPNMSSLTDLALSGTKIGNDVMQWGQLTELEKLNLSPFCEDGVFDNWNVKEMSLLPKLKILSIPSLFLADVDPKSHVTDLTITDYGWDVKHNISDIVNKLPLKSFTRRGFMPPLGFTTLRSSTITSFSYSCAASGSAVRCIAWEDIKVVLKNLPSLTSLHISGIHDTHHGDIKKYPDDSSVTELLSYKNLKSLRICPSNFSGSGIAKLHTKFKAFIDVQYLIAGSQHPSCDTSRAMSERWVQSNISKHTTRWLM